MIRVEVKVDKNEIYNDVARLTAYIGAKRPELVEGYQRIFTVDEDKEFHDSTFDRARAECIETFYAFTKKPIKPDTEESPREFEEDLSKNIVLHLPDEFSQTTVDLIKCLVHDYLVDWIIFDWLIVVEPKEAAVWEAKMLQIKKRIQEVKNNRMKPITRPLQPFQ